MCWQVLLRQPGERMSAWWMLLEAFYVSDGVTQMQPPHPSMQARLSLLHPSPGCSCHRDLNPAANTHCVQRATKLHRDSSKLCITSKLSARPAAHTQKNSSRQIKITSLLSLKHGVCTGSAAGAVDADLAACNLQAAAVVLRPGVPEAQQGSSSSNAVAGTGLWRQTCYCCEP
jgi:hypothetical protein